MNLNELKELGEAPQWLTKSGFKTLSEGYMLPGETPRGMYERVAAAAASQLKKPELIDKFFNYMWKGWLCPATPVLSNMGTDRGLPISCFGMAPGDDLFSIYNSFVETAMLTKSGGGCGKYWGLLRQKGAPIKGNGVSDGIIPWLKVEEATLHSTAQAGLRRGSGCSYLPIESADADEFIELRRRTGDIARRTQSSNFHHAVCISDAFMDKCRDGDIRSRELWHKLLTTRVEENEPFIMFSDTANRNKPDCYKHFDLDIKSSQLCTEIFLFSDPDHTYVCCLSSLNFFLWEEWKHTDLAQTAMWFLDGVMEEFIQKSEGKPGLENARRFAIKSRAVGLGCVGWHSLLQDKMLPFESFQSMLLNTAIWKHVHDETLIASKELAKEYGEPEWCKGFGIRNTHRLAQAPTRTNSLIAGGVSEGIAPIPGNVYVDKTAKGAFIRGSAALENLLEALGKNTNDVWDQIAVDGGSVRNLKFLTDDQKKVFLTAREINQFALIQQASQRQKWIDQGQSLNLFLSPPPPDDLVKKRKFSEMVHRLHIAAYLGELKSLYYLFSENILKGDSAYDQNECKSCEG